MSIVRAPRPHRYTQVDNQAVEDPRLSFKAKGLLVYVLSKPDHWRTNREQLASVGPDGVDAVRTALRELETAGYIKRHRRRVEAGRFEWDAEVHEVPQPQVATSGGLSTGGQTTGGEPTDVVKTEVATPEQLNLSAGAKAPGGAQGTLTGVSPQTDPQSVDAPRNPVADAARALVRRVYDNRTPRPAGKFIALAKIAQRLLEAGHEVAAVEQAYMTTPAFTTAALEFQLNGGRNGNGRSPSAVIDPGPSRDAWDVEGAFFNQEVPHGT